MKVWENAEVKELSINETAHNVLGTYFDGGYIGDGQISGHLSNSNAGFGKPGNIFEAIIGNGTPVDQLS